MRNVGLKAFSVIAALLLSWFVHSEGNSAVRTYVAPIELHHLPNDRIVLSPLNPSAQITIKGPSFIVSTISSSPPVFAITFPEKLGKTYSAQLDPRSLKLPTHVEVINVDPPSIDFVLDDLTRREFAVVVPKIGSVDETLRVAGITVTPEKITATGPISVLRELPSLETEPLDLRKLQQSTKVALAIRNVPQLTRLSTETATISVEIAPVVTEKRFDALPLEVRAAPGERYQMATTTVSAVVSGAKGKMSELKRAEILPYVRLSSSIAESGEATIGIDAPDGISVVSIDPPVVKVVKLPDLKRDAGKAIPGAKIEGKRGK